MAFKVVGKVVVTTAGTRVQLAAQTNVAAYDLARTIRVQFPSVRSDGSTANTGLLYIGDSTVSATAWAGVSDILQPGDSMYIPCFGNSKLTTANLYADASVNGAEFLVSVVTE